MKYETFGHVGKPIIILLHGGGLSNWIWRPQIEAWKENYFIIAPIIDGHGADYKTTFETIAHSADQIIQYIKDNYNGKVFAIVGLSLGAQITVEILAKKKNICEKAVIESALVIPLKALVKLVVPLYRMSFPLVSKKWFSKISAYYYCIPKDMFRNYFEDTKKVSIKTMINMTLSNSNYSIPPNFAKTEAKLLILCAKNEAAVMKKSAKALHAANSNSTLRIIQKSKHGISIQLPGEYISIVSEFFEN